MGLVIGVFDNIDGAQQAAAALRQSGIAVSNVSLVMQSVEGGLTTITPDTANKEGLLGSLGDFFSSITDELVGQGVPAAEEHFYDQALAQGGVLVTANAAAQDIAAAQAVLRQSGARDTSSDAQQA